MGPPSVSGHKVIENYVKASISMIMPWSPESRKVASNTQELFWKTRGVWKNVSEIIAGTISRLSCQSEFGMWLTVRVSGVPKYLAQKIVDDEVLRK